MSVAHIFAPVKVAAFKRVDKRLGGSDIGCNGNVVNVAQAQQVDVVRLVGLCVQRVAEEDEQVYLVAGNAGGELLVAALRSAQKTLYVKPGSLCDQFSGGAGGAYFMVAQNTAVCDTELNHKLLFRIVSNKCYIQDCSLLSLY